MIKMKQLLLPEKGRIGSKSKISIQNNAHEMMIITSMIKKQLQGRKTRTISNRRSNKKQNKKNNNNKN